MKLPVIRHISNFIESNSIEYATNSIKFLEDICDARGIKEVELDVIGELLSNLEGALEVQKLMDSGMSQKDALNSFMQRVTNIGK